MLQNVFSTACPAFQHSTGLDTSSLVSLVLWSLPKRLPVFLVHFDQPSGSSTISFNVDRDLPVPPLILHCPYDVLLQITAFSHFLLPQSGFTHTRDTLTIREYEATQIDEGENVEWQ